MYRILLVEDHPMNRKLFRDILSFEFVVDEAECAAEARERIRAARPDLVLMDMQLPDLDGASLVREFKAQPEFADIPMIALSAHAMQHNIDDALDAGCLAYITKPLTDDPFDFLDRLKGYIQTPAGG